MKLILLFSVFCFFSVSSFVTSPVISPLLAKSKKSEEKIVKNVSFDSYKLPKRCRTIIHRKKKRQSCQRIRAPRFRFQYASNFHIHSYDGQSININDWSSLDNYKAASMIVRWRRRPFLVKEEKMYLKLGEGKEKFQMASTRDLKVKRARRQWALKGQYDYNQKFISPVSSPESLGKKASYKIRPYKANIEESILTLRCGGYHMLINFKARTEKSFSTANSAVKSILNSFRCG